jgi:hypothetical protein
VGRTEPGSKTGKPFAQGAGRPLSGAARLFAQAPTDWQEIKDHEGLLSFLVACALLSLRGVPRETVMADFMRTNEYTLPQFMLVIDEFVDAGGDRAIAEAVFGVKPEYLEASFDEMHKCYAANQRCFAEGLGTDAGGHKALRKRYATYF